MAATMLDQTREKFSKRLAELQPAVEEYTELERVLSALGEAPKSKNGRKRSTGKRAGRGDRPAEFLAAIAEHPGITVTEAAKVTGVNQNYLYRLARELTEAGKVRKIDSGYHPVPADEEVAAPTTETAQEPVAA